MFPRGEYGWCPGIEAGTARPAKRPRAAVQAADLEVVPRASRKQITLREFVVYYMMERDAMPDGSPYCSYLQSFGALYEEWLVLQWAKEEQSRLKWLQNNQDTIRADLYQNVVQLSQAATATPASQVGRRVVLPSSFTGGPRFMTQLYHDGMAMVRSMGKADLFITMTALCLFWGGSLLAFLNLFSVPDLWL
jgi:hypothetical protein